MRLHAFSPLDNYAKSYRATLVVIIITIRNKFDLNQLNDNNSHLALLPLPGSDYNPEIRQQRLRIRTKMKKPLTELKPGSNGVISAHMSKGAIRQRLLDLGLMPEAEIEYVRSAPLGDPIEVRVGMTNVVIRATEAETVIVEV